MTEIKETSSDIDGDLKFDNFTRYLIKRKYGNQEILNFYRELFKKFNFKIDAIEIFTNLASITNSSIINQYVNTFISGD